jgi:DNA-binding NarL/FixJ family response regulator
MTRNAELSGPIDLLIVEDRPVMRAMLREFVQRAFPDLSILDVANGTRAMELCAEEMPELVLMDVCLPDANGIELTARIRRQWPGIRVIVVSYLGGEAYVDRANAAGAYAYIVKDRLTLDLLPAIAGALSIASSGPSPGLH